MKKTIAGGPGYFEALGRFIEEYAEVEQALSGLLWSVAKVSMPVARAIFSGTRSEAAGQYINRILEVTKGKKILKRDLPLMLVQLKLIREARNLIIHNETKRKRDQVVSVTNRRIALNKRALHERPMSPEILRQMTADLERITAHLIMLLFCDDKVPKRQIAMVKRAYESELNAAWQYIPPKPNPAQSKNRSPRRDHNSGSKQ